MIQVHICGRGEIPDFKDKSITHLVSIIDPQESLVVTPEWINPSNHVTYKFHDVEAPGMSMTPEKWEIKEVMDHLRELYSLSERGGNVNLLVHCFAGIGRSVSIAYILMCLIMGSGKESEAWKEIHRLRKWAWGNLMIISYGDEFLQRNGKMVEVVKEFRQNECGTVSSYF